MKLSLFSREDRLKEERNRVHLHFRFKSKAQLKSRMKAGMKVKVKAKVKDEDVVTDGPILKKGWLKFIIFDPRQGDSLSNFYINNAFFEEQKVKQIRQSEPQCDAYGPMDIPD